MLFNSFIFWFFLLVTLPIYFLIKNQKVKKVYLICISLFFYAYWNWQDVPLLLTSIIFNYLIGLKINQCISKQKWLIFGVITNLTFLGIYKYYNFFIATIIQICTSLTLEAHFDILQLSLPLGISFFTFHGIGYLIDIYRKQYKASKSYLDFSLYMCFFPFLIAGPIVRGKDFIPQLKQIKIPSKNILAESFHLIALGLFQKIMIGDNCGKIVDSVFYDFSRYTAFEIISATLLFSFQIYADFSGYSNIARGIAKLFGVELMINFKQPYLSQNIKDFWATWHISLSTWLRDYLYIPLGGNRQGQGKTLRNLLVVMLLGGLWHGAGWNFILWGIYHGVLLIIYHKINWKSENTILNTTTTFFFVTLGWFLFRINSLEQLNQFTHKLLYFEWGEHALRFLKIFTAFGILSFSIDYLQRRHQNDAFLFNFKNRYFATGIATTLILASLLSLYIKKPSPFIYFQF